jgi:glycerate kinase
LRGAVVSPTPSSAGQPGAGAAGGAAYAALAALGARVRPGVDLVLEIVGLVGALGGARLLVTGEGSWTRSPPAGRIAPALST